MEQLTVEVIAGLVVAILSAIGGFLLRSKSAQDNWVLPRASRHVEKQSYTHLNGKWHLFWLSYHPEDNKKPFWFHAVQGLTVDGSRVQGGTKFDAASPMPGLNSKIQGEIRAGTIIMTDTCVEDETEFASVIYPNLRSRELLVGAWSGLDNLSGLSLPQQSSVGMKWMSKH